MHQRKPGRLKQADYRNAQKLKGLREITTWLPEDILGAVDQGVSEGRFESKQAAYMAAIRLGWQELTKTVT